LVNSRTQDIGARRLHTILERLLDPVSFDASDPGRPRDEVIDASVVRARLKEVVEDEDLSRYILWKFERKVLPVPTPQSAVPTVERPHPSGTRVVIERAQEHLLQNYRQQPVVLDHGQGTRVWDADGNVYLDLLGGIACLPFGHCHPEITQAAKAQLDKLWHTSNVFYTEPQVRLAELLTAASGLDRAFFCNSGAEANEAMLKLARKAQRDRGQPGRFEFVCFDNSFHGRTLATVSVTGQPKYQKGFEPLLPGVVHVPYGDLEAVKRAV